MGDVRIPDLNSVIIAGRLTRDPELRYTSSGTAYCKLGIANTRYYKAQSGERREETVFVDVTVWDKQAEWAGESLRKGRPVLVEGSLRMNEWEDKSTGQKRNKIELKAQRITPLDWEDKSSTSSEQRPSPKPTQEPTQEQRPHQDDIPF